MEIFACESKGQTEKLIGITHLTMKRLIFFLYLNTVINCNIFSIFKSKAEIGLV